MLEITPMERDPAGGKESNEIRSTHGAPKISPTGQNCVCILFFSSTSREPNLQEVERQKRILP